MSDPVDQQQTATQPEAGAPGATTTRYVGPGGTPIQVTTRGDVDAATIEDARRRIEAVIEHVQEPVLFARLKLSIAGHPERTRPALLQASIDLDGHQLRAHAAAHDLQEAAHLVQRRLFDKLEQRASRRQALRRRSGRPEAGEWRHGDLPTDRPDHYDRPVEERQLVRHKTFALEDLTVDEAAFDMDQLDYDWYLFRELASGQDAVLERSIDGWELTRLHPVDTDPGPTAIPLTVTAQVPGDATVGEAIARLDTTGERFVFFGDATSGRGNVVYRRYDGHYGLVTPA